MRSFWILVLLLFSLPAFSQEEEKNPFRFNYKGFIDSYQAARTGDGWDYMSSRNRVRFECGLEKGSASAFVSVNAVYNPILKDQTGLFLREAYLDYNNEGWGLKVGKQIVTWGVADGLQLTDIISPMDYTEFLAQDYDDIRVPVTAVRFGYGTPLFHVEAVFIPVPEFYILPSDAANPWAVRMNGIPCHIVQSKPSFSLPNSEFGLRTSFYFSGIDFSLCALHTYNKMPAFTTTGVDEYGQLMMNAENGRMTMVGGDFSIPLGKFVIRGEVAEYFNALQTVSQMGVSPLTKNQTLALIGLDWYPGSDWTIMLQYEHTYISDYDNRISAYRNSGMATVNIKKELFRNMLKLSAFGRIDCANEGAFFIRFNADYLLTDQITLTAGYDWFRADAGTFAMYKDNSEVFIKAKFSF